MAAYAIQFRRGTTTEHNSFTGLLGEVTVDTTKKTIVVHDGSNAGGSALALEGAATNTTTGTFSSNVTIGGTLSVAGNLTMTGHVLPSADVTYDLGSSSKQWRDIYVGPGSLYVNGTKVIEDDSGTINITTDINEDLKITTSGTGTLKLISANGINLTGELGATSGDLQIGDHIDMNSYLIKEVATPVSTTDAANKAYVDTTSASAVTGGANALSVTTGAFSGNVTMAGNLTVSGTTTTINTAQINIADNIIVLNSDATGTATINAGIEVERGDDANKQLIWDETNDRWSLSSEDIDASTFIGNLTGNVTGALTGNSAGVHTGDVTGNITGNITGNVTGDVTGNVTGNSAGVHTGAVTGAVTGNVIGNVTGNLTGNSAGVHTGAVTGNVTGNTSGSAGTVTSIAAHLLDEDNMASNSATKVASQQSVKAYVDAQILTEDNTDEIVEGSTNLYYTDARARAAISATGSLAYNSTTGVISFTMNDETVEDIVGGMLTGNTETGITVTYEDSDGTMDFVVASQTDENFTTADHSKLDGIEASATADQTDAEIRAGVEAASDSNVFTDADHSKLNAIESTADVTDGTNVAAAGAVMESDATTAAMSMVVDEDNMVSNSATKLATQQSIKAYADAGDSSTLSSAQSYADTAEADAVTTAAAAAEAKDVARMTTSDAYADASEAAAIASAESKDIARMVTSDAYADASEAAAVSTASADATSKANAAQSAAVSTASADATSKANAAQSAAEATASADATAKVAVLTAGASASLDTLLEIANVMATDTELSNAIAALNHDSLSGFVANEHIDWTADQGATNVHAGNYTDTNTTYSVGDGGLTQINFTSADNSKLDGIAASATNVTNNNQITNGAGYITGYTNTTYTAGNGLGLSGTVFSMDGQYTGDFTVSGDITAQGGDVTATRFNGTATYALYADLAERYAADAPYEEGTVVMFGGEAEVTSAQGYGSTKIAGVVSTKPAFAMNEAAGNSETHPYIALQGRVPCKVMGTVSKGDMLVASEVSGIATAWTDSTTDPRMTAYVGIAIEDKTTDAVGYIEVKVGK
jgi:hypothetical protein